MREIEIGVRFDLKDPPTFFGTDEVNALVNAGAVIAAIVPGGVIAKRLGEGGGNVQLTISGFSMKVHLTEPPAKVTGA